MRASTFQNDSMVLQFLHNTGIQAVLDMDGVTEVSVNQPGNIWYEGQDGWQVVAAPQATYTNLEHLATACGACLILDCSPSRMRTSSL